MIALYERVSTAEQAREGYSIGEQQERLTAYCKSRGWTGYKHFTDAGYSGGNINRPAMQDMIAAIKDGTVSRVVVYKLDRLSRSQKDTLELIEDVFIPNGVDFVSMCENFETGSPFGKAMVGVLSVFAQLERDTIRERVTIGREARAKDGKYHGGSTPPVGYDYIEGCLVVNDFEAMQVRECFRLYETGFTYTEIADTLNAKGWTHKYGRWILQRVRTVLQNTIYTGVITFGGQQYDGAHEAIIDHETFEAVGAMIAKNHKSHSHKGTNGAYLIGKIYCARCGKRYTHARSTSGHKKDGVKISYYTCSARNHPKNAGHRCDNTVHRADAIDGVVFDSLRELSYKAVIEYRQQEPDSTAELKKELAKIDKQRSRLIDLYSVGTFSADELTAKIETLNASRQAIEKQIQNTQRPADELKTVIDSIGGILDAGDPVAIRQIIDTLIDHVDIDGEDVTIYWDFD